MEEQIFLDLMNKSMLASVRQVRLSLGRPSSHATRQQALQQVAMLKAAKDLFMQQRKAAESSQEPELTLDEINEEIRAARIERSQRA